MNAYTEPERQAFALGQAVGLGFIQPLSLMRPGSAGRILTVSSGSVGDHDVERGLLEMGFVEGACVEVLHHGFWRRDPLAVRINQTMTVALRRCEASAVLVGPLLDPAMGTASVANGGRDRS